MSSDSFFTPGSYISVSTLGQNLRVRQDIARVRGDILQAQNQLASGKRSDTHGGLRAQATTAQDLRHTLGRMSGYQDTMALAQSRLSTIQSALVGVQGAGQTISEQAFKAFAPGMPEDISMLRTVARSNLDGMVGSLNASHAGRYLFSGAKVDVQPVVSSEALVSGQGGRRGLTDVVALRLQADSGAAGTGRVTATAAAGVTTIRHDGGAFGMKLSSIGAAPASASITLGQPGQTAVNQVDATVSFTGPIADGQRIGIDFEMPDGTIKSISFVANSTAANGDATGLTDTYSFTNGAPLENNLRDAINTALTDVVSRHMAGHSAIAAGNDFFDHQVARVPDGAMPATATGYAMDSGTVIDWYSGETAASTVTGIGDTPPAGPAKGDVWLIGGSPVGDWAGRDGQIASWNGNTWEFTTPENGARFVDDNGRMRVYDGSIAPPGLKWTDAGQAPTQLSARDSVRGKIDDGLYVSYGARANETAIRDSLKGIAVVVAAAYDANAPQAFQLVAQQVGGQLRGARDGIIAARSEIGVTEERIESMSERQKDHATVLKIQLSNVEGIDDYEVATALQDMMARLQSSYQITARLSQMTLTNYL